MSFDSVFHGAPSSNNGQAVSGGIASLGIDASSGQIYYRSPESGGWQKNASAGGVTSVFTRTGAVVALAGDYSAFYPQGSGALGSFPLWTASNTLGNSTIATEAPNTIGNGTALVIKSPTPASAIAQVELHNQYSGAFAAYCQSVVGNLGRTATVSLYKSHGANLAAAPLAVVANDALGEVEYNGYDGTTYTGLGYTGWGGGIWECDAIEDWDSTHHGTAVLLSTIVKGTNNTVGCFLRLGGITSGSPAIVKDGAQVHLRLADDSADAGLIASTSTLTAAAPTVAASRVGLGSTTAATATAGGGQLALATVLGYLVANVGGTTVKIPYFAN